MADKNEKNIVCATSMPKLTTPLEEESDLVRAIITQLGGVEITPENDDIIMFERMESQRSSTDFDWHSK